MVYFTSTIVLKILLHHHNYCTVVRVPVFGTRGSRFIVQALTRYANCIYALTVLILCGQSTQCLLRYYERGNKTLDLRHTSFQQCCNGVPAGRTLGTPLSEFPKRFPHDCLLSLNMVFSLHQLLNGKKSEDCSHATSVAAESVTSVLTNQ